MTSLSSAQARAALDTGEALDPIHPFVATMTLLRFAQPRPFARIAAAAGVATAAPSMPKNLVRICAPPGPE